MLHPAIKTHLFFISWAEMQGNNKLALEHIKKLGAFLSKYKKILPADKAKKLEDEIVELVGKTKTLNMFNKERKAA